MEEHMCRFNANQTPRTFQLPASAVWTCGAAWKTALEGLRRTQWGLLAVFRALTLVPSYLYDPGWPLAGLATTKGPKRGRRRMERRSKQNRETERKKKNTGQTFCCVSATNPAFSLMAVMTKHPAWSKKWGFLLSVSKHQPAALSGNEGFDAAAVQDHLRTHIYFVFCCFFSFLKENRMTRVRLLQIWDILFL